MKTNKRAEFRGLVGVFLVIAVILIAWVIVSGSLKELSAATINAMKEKLGMDIKEEKLIKEREKEIEKENNKKTIEFLNSLVDGYESCLSKKDYSDLSFPGIEGACNCNLNINLNNLINYKIKIEKSFIPNINTVFILRNPSNEEIARKEISQIFMPCKKIPIATGFSPDCSINNLIIDREFLDSAALDEQPALAIAKDKNGRGLIFFSDDSLPICSSK